ncbi:bifunctional RNase H/acid phosphatase [Nocardioides sp. CER19]|uniref:bifunctional RNase H/acid phosphatase n=1 Tax=Nocardioides sp. CER19 TaxID=3038538 RepID=UPI002449A4FD|nr:bifunctional RNase H/acid phosphatase [Nocardioides sp. CER19]MDH2416255.1 bifunctional RNase H/acid phosphatase [Nocardioides sp. CER19]
MTLEERDRPAAVVVEADGGSRGNPGPAAYGAVLKDAATGEVIAEDGTTIGVATNNVAEYSGLIAGLRLAAELTPDADVEVRMDSKLVVEQMSGRWRIKHPDMKPLAEEAGRLAPAGTTYTWVPRGANKHADRLVNEALDGVRSGVTVAGGEDASLIEELQDPAPPLAREGEVEPGAPTTLVLVRHGVTPHTTGKRFSGGLASANPGLSDDGRSQIRMTADWLAPLAERAAVVVASPVRRTLESAQIIAETLGLPVETEPGLAEMEFGRWDGLTFAEVADRFPEEMERWRGSLDVAPEGGESFRVVEKRVADAVARLRERYAGRTVIVVSHVTPIKTLVAHALEAPLESLFRMELSPASVSVVSFYPSPGEPDRASLRLYNALPPGRSGFDPATTTW